MTAAMCWKANFSVSWPLVSSQRSIKCPSEYNGLARITLKADITENRIHARLVPLQNPDGRALDAKSWVGKG
jgi:hypothetical protein